MQQLVDSIDNLTRAASESVGQGIEWTLTQGKATL
jgi:hypothetical protein